MPEPTGLRNITVQEKRNTDSQRKLPTELFCFIALCQLASGFNFGLAKFTNGKFKTTVNIITILTACWSVTSLSIILYFNVGIELYWSTIYFVQYLLSISILYFAKYSLSEFLADLISTYKKPTKELKYDKVGLFWLYVTWVLIINCASSIVYNVYAKGHVDFIQLFKDTFILLPAFGFEMMPVANYLLFFHVYARMRELKRQFKHQEINLKQLRTSYKAIADSFGRFRKGYDSIFVCGFLTNSPKWIIIIFNHLTYMKSATSWLMLAFSYAWALHVTVQICVPAVFAEMISVQTDAMKIILREQIFIETDETQALEIARVVEYMQARPLLRKAWRLVPLDLQLPITMLSLNATYLIVVVQFLHLYD